MAPRPNVPTTAELVVRGQRLGNEVINVFHFDTITAVTNALLNEILDEFLTTAMEQFLACITSDYSVVEVTCTDISTTLGTQLSGVFVGTPVGTFGGNGLPGNVAFALNWQTPFRGRTTHGRTYMPGLAEGSVTGDVVAADLLDAYDAFGNAMLAMGTGTGDYAFGITSFKDIATRIVTAYVLENITDSMRRRLTGRGA
jgi:hypothetical protein